MPASDPESFAINSDELKLLIKGVEVIIINFAAMQRAERVATTSQPI